VTTHRRRLRAALTTAAALAALVLPVAAPSANAAPAAFAAPGRPVALPEPPSADAARGELAELAVEAPHPMTGYSRAKFPHWSKQYGTCDTREVVLQRDGTDVVTDDQCRALSGTWVSVYDDRVLTASSQIDIDHVVPLAASWRSGADLWDTATRQRFANDLEHSQLIAVSAASNRSKGDQSPDQWKPPSRAYWCTYARAWTDVKHVYRLSVTDAEKTALGDMLDTCPAH
jgi:hypothetical protein